jgi:MFS family permease
VSAPSSSRWRALAAWSLAASFFGYAFVQRVSPGVMVNELMRDFAVGGAILGNLSAFYFYTYASLQVGVGVLMDRLGPRRLMAGAAAFCASGSVLFALSEAIELAYLGRAIIGAGAAFGWIGVLTLAARFFPARRFALLTGLGQVMGMAGAMLGQAPLAALVAASGWRGAMLVIGIAGLVLALSLWLVVRDGTPAPSASSQPVSLLSGLKLVLSNGQTWLLALFGLACTGPMLAFSGLWGIPYVSRVYGIDRTSAAAVVSLMYVGWMIGAPGIGWLSDHLGRRRPLMIGGIALAALTLLVILYLPGLNLALLGLLFILNGAGSAAMVLSFATAREHNPPQATGAVLGVINTAVVGSGALFQPLIGLLLDLQWDGALEAGGRVYAPDAYRLALAVLPAGCAIGLAAALATRETFCRPR